MLVVCSITGKTQSLEEFKSNYKSSNNTLSPKAVESEPPGGGDGPLPEILSAVKDINNIMKEGQSETSVTQEWTHIATIWERFMFWIVLLVVVIVVPCLFLQAADKAGRL